MDQSIKEGIRLVELLPAKILPWVSSASCSLGVICMKLVCGRRGEGSGALERESSSVSSHWNTFTGFYNFDGSVKDKSFEGQKMLSETVIKGTKRALR